MKTIHYIINRSNTTIDTAMFVIELAIKLAEFEDFGGVVGKSLNIGEDDGATVCMHRERERERERERDTREIYSVEMLVSHTIKVYNIL